MKQLKTAGSGKLPKDIQRRKTEHFTATANDAFATIRITAKDATEACYAEILDYLCAVLEQPEFPRSYSIEFRGKEKLYLPIPGLPKKGVHQLFACAVQHPNLHPAMEQYARLAMREFEWYQNLTDEASAMPGSFAVFALGLEGEPWAPLVAEYLDLCDDEHSSLQGKFLHALIRKFGFQPWTLGVLVRGALSMQWLEPAKEFRSLIANAESLDALLTVKRRFSAYLLLEENKDPKFRAIAWQSLLWAIWGKNSENGGSKVIKTAPKELKEKYQQVFARGGCRMNSEQITAFLQEYWYIASVLIGVVILIGAIRNWNWLCDPTGTRDAHRWYAGCPPPRQRIPAGGVLSVGCPPDCGEYLGICAEIEIEGERL